MFETQFGQYEIGLDSITFDYCYKKRVGTGEITVDKVGDYTRDNQLCTMPFSVTE